MFPFGRGSDGSKSVIDYLHSNHNYQTRITDAGKFQEVFSFYFIDFYSGVVLYKIQDGEMNFDAARASCAQDQGFKI